MTYWVFDVDCVTPWLKEAESTVENVWIYQLGDQVIYQFHGDFLLCVFTEELWVRILENDLDFHADCQNNHRHVESHEDSFPSVFRL